VCAKQVEIDDYRDYEKAAGALREALKYLGKAGESRTAQDMAAATEQRIALIERFVRARKAAQKDPVTMVELCVGLLKEPLLEDAIRSGDCLAMLVRNIPSPFLRALFCVLTPVAPSYTRLSGGALPRGGQPQGGLHVPARDGGPVSDRSHATLARIPRIPFFAPPLPLHSPP